MLPLPSRDPIPRGPRNAARVRTDQPSPRDTNVTVDGEIKTIEAIVLCRTRADTFRVMSVTERGLSPLPETNKKTISA
jgi:hypothetical protein